MDTGNEPPVPADRPGAGQTAEPTLQSRTRDGRGKFARTIDTARRDAEAAEYLADHPGTTYRELAERFGYYDRGTAWRAIQAVKVEVVRPAVTKLIETESEELDALYVMALEIIERNHIVVSHGKVVTMKDPETGEEKPLQDDGPRLQAIQTALRVRESYRKLRGLDQPSQVAVSGGVKYEVVGIDPADLT
ncbi:hypothetical protein [Streptomyces sp. NPDC005302]|uniref:hypothetical protein n=1 Tax=Streptomyces sp. NPDC005302 TaxID=3154675 RepID=UPI0033A68E1F